MRIAFVCSEYPPAKHGGIGTMVRMLARRLTARGHSVRVVGYQSLGAGLAEQEIDHGVEVTRIPIAPGRLMLLRARRRIHRLLQRWTACGGLDLVEVPDYQGWAAGWRPMRAPVVVRYNGSSSYFARELDQPLQYPDYWIERASLRRAQFHCSVSRYTADRTAHVFNYAPETCEVIYNPIEATDVSPRRPSQNTVVFSGTLVGKKGVVELLKSWPKVAAQNPGAKLHLYGKDGKAPDGGSMQEYLSRMAGERLRRSVFFHGHVKRDEVLAAIANAGVAVFPSFAEAFAFAPLEAMASACPTIYSTRGSGPELIRNGEDGILVDPSKPKDIANAISAVLQSDELASRLGESGRRRVLAKFTIDRIIQQNERFYERCIRAKKA